MTYTINGIGTTYFGKSNQQSEDGVCSSCHTRGKLLSYETWHCICVFFIPLIPLGKKQILDYCPSCTRHRVLSFHEWVKIRDATINETATQFSASPDDPDAAIQMHATLATFQKQDEATKLADLMSSKFPEVAKVLFYLAAWYERTGKPLTANPLFLRAYDLEPNNIDYRRAALLTFIEEGNVDQAKSMIQPFLPGTENYQPAMFYALAAGFQKQQRHEEAVQTLRMLLDASPGLRSDPTFRKTLAISEKAMGVEELTIPADPFYRSKGFLWVSGITTVLAALALYNSYLASNRSVTVVNGLPIPISVKIDGRPELQLSPGDQKQTILPEGTHEVAVTVPADQFPAMKFDVGTSWWERFMRTPAFVLDPTRSAVVLWEEATYMKVRPGQQPPENRSEMRVGELFSYFKHIDYRLEEFPAQLKVKNSSSVVKTRMTILRDDPATLLQRSQLMGMSPNGLLPFLETHLMAAPERNDLMHIYTAWSISDGRFNQCRDFLKKRLTDRPVRVEWHRAYQAVSFRGVPNAEARKQHEQLKQEYDLLLAKEPNDPSMLYLRGRIENQGTKSLPYFEKALAADPQFPFALYAIGHSRLVKGEFGEALELLTKAVEAKPGEMTFEHQRLLAQFAARDFETLEKTSREQLAKASLDSSALETLLKTLVATNRADEADKEFEAYSTRFKQMAPPQFHSMLQSTKWILASLKGDFELVDREASATPTDQARQFAFLAKLQLNQLADPPGTVQPGWHLCREIVARRLGDDKAAQVSRDAAIAALEQLSEDDWAVADLLRRSKDVSWDEVEDIVTDPTSKAIVLVTVARERKEIRSQLLELATKLNFDLAFPHYLLKREIEELQKE